MKKPGISMLFPKASASSAYAIDYRSFYAAGYRGVIYDIDNTLVRHDAPANSRAIALFRHLKAIGFSVGIISNNAQKRAEMFADRVGADVCIWLAGKPEKDGYLKAMTVMGTEPGTTMFVGDQLFTDILGANRAGAFSVLVPPLYKDTYIHIMIKRWFEKPVLWLYHRKLEKNR